MNENQIKAKTGFAIYHDLFIKSSLSKVFETITEPDHLINWWPLKCSEILRSGVSTISTLPRNIIGMVE